MIDIIYLKYLKAKISYVNDKRIETYPFARDAIREAVFNAIIHKVYFSNIPIQIKITDHAMYISNDCCLPDDWTKETLLNHHRSIPYNPNIAKTFYRCGYVETWGRGIQKIHEACKSHGTSIPEYSIYSSYMEVKFDCEEIHNKKICENYVFNEIEMKILNEIEKNPFVTQRELSKILGVSKTSVNKYVNELVQKNKISKIATNSRLLQYSINKK